MHLDRSLAHYCGGCGQEDLRTTTSLTIEKVAPIVPASIPGRLLVHKVELRGFVACFCLPRLYSTGVTE